MIKFGNDAGYHLGDVFLRMILNQESFCLLIFEPMFYICDGFPLFLPPPERISPELYIYAAASRLLFYLLHLYQFLNTPILTCRLILNRVNSIYQHLYLEFTKAFLLIRLLILN